MAHILFGNFSVKLSGVSILGGCVDKVVMSVFCTLRRLNTSEGRVNGTGCWQCVACVCFTQSFDWIKAASQS